MIFLPFLSPFLFPPYHLSLLEGAENLLPKKKGEVLPPLADYTAMITIKAGFWEGVNEFLQKIPVSSGVLCHHLMSPPSRLPSRMGETLFRLTAGLVIVRSSPLLRKRRRRPIAGVLVAAVLKLLQLRKDGSSWVKLCKVL